jgi:hypothetical protein
MKGKRWEQLSSKQHPIERQSKRMMMGNDDNAIVITGIGKALL